MMQMEAQMDMGNEAKTSGLAIAGLVCALILCIPVLPLIGAVLGVVAVISIGSNPAKKGKGLALSAIVLGLVITVGQSVAINAAVDYFKGWAVYVMEGPNEALTDGFSGDLTGFKSAFTTAGASASDDDAKAFLDTLEDRYGAFIDTNMTGQQTQGQMGQPQQAFPYTLNFDKGPVQAEVELVFHDPTTNEMKKIGYIKVFDEEQGDLTYPPEQSP